MTALRVRLWFWRRITWLSYFSKVFYQIKNFFFLLWVNLYMIMGLYFHDPPPFKRSIFHDPSLFWVSESCDPPSVSTPLPPANFWQVPLKVMLQMSSLVTWSQRASTKVCVYRLVHFTHLALSVDFWAKHGATGVRGGGGRFGILQKNKRRTQL